MMIKKYDYRFPLLILLCLTMVVNAKEPGNLIRINTLGYLPEAAKIASVAAPCSSFKVVKVDDLSIALEGAVGEPIKNNDTRETLYLADFSELKVPGSYQLVIDGVGKSVKFEIRDDLYADPFRVVTRAMYLWRCGTAVKGEHRGKVYQHEACHLEDAYLDYVGGGHEKRPSFGGWHDAGDYNKYVVNAGVTVDSMLRAWEDFWDEIENIALDLPESGGTYPDFLAEIKWELDWLLTMQDEDGSVYHKVSTLNFGGFMMPEDEEDPRYFVPWDSAATADFAAMLAKASSSFRSYDEVYADRCLEAAIKSYRFLLANPEQHRAEQSEFNTGRYESDDTDDRLWAAAEIWEATGDPNALKDVEQRMRKSGTAFDLDLDWGTVKALGLMTYLFSERVGRNAELVASLKKDLLKAADTLCDEAAKHGYERPFGELYYWGCNGTVARQSLLLHAASRLQPKPAYRENILKAINHLFGRNVHGRSYVTGLGDGPPLYPHDRRLDFNGTDTAWPGYLVGGPNPKAKDWFDEIGSFRTNEIAINWNGALIYALASVLVETP